MTAVLSARPLAGARNPLLKVIRRAVTKGTVTDRGLCVAESFHLLEEALRSDCRVDSVLAAASVRGDVERCVRGRVRVMVVEDDVFAGISSTETAQGVIALVEAPAWTMERIFRAPAMVVVIDGVQDPGNAGAILRAAEAFAATGVLFLKGAAGPYHPKTLRASAGSVFRVPLAAAVDPQAARATIEQKRLSFYAADPRGETAAGDADLRRGFALAVGSEAHGVSGRLRANATGLRIPSRGVESLNAAMAAGIILYEAARQRAHP
ncbi:MAG: TrmH family RNA methyltransferase [Bryobacteraceae bacterium]